MVINMPASPGASQVTSLADVKFHRWAARGEASVVPWQLQRLRQQQHWHSRSYGYTMLYLYKYVSMYKYVYIIPLWISSLELHGSCQISTIFLGKIFATFSLCTISCLPPQPVLLILERFFVLDFREIGVFQVWILRPRYFDSKNI